MSGATWLDTYSNICVYLMNEKKFTSQEILRVACVNPGGFVNKFLKYQFKGKNFGRGFGKIEKGYIGNLTILDLNKKQVIKEANLQTKCQTSPLCGMKFSGGLKSVIIRGVDETNNFL